MNNVLFIAYQIPPIGGPAAQRHIRFLYRLPSLGWNPTILTIDPDYCEDDFQKDIFLMKYIPPTVKINRTSSFNPMDRFLAFRKTIKTNKNSIINNEQKDQRAGLRCQRRVLWELLKDFVSESFRIPDRQIGWYPFAVACGIRILRNTPVQVIYSSGGPWTAHLVGLTLQRLFRLPWIADFRDPWSLNPYNPQRFRFIDNIEKKFESKVIENATYVVCNTKPLMEQFQDSYLGINKEKFVHISNGYLAAAFEDLDYIKNDDRFIITHVGTLYAKRSPLPLLHAVSRLKRQGMIHHENFLVRFVGEIELSNIDDKLLSEMDIDDVIEIIPFVPHTDAINYLARSDVLLIIQPDTKLQIPGKLFEYIAVGHSILGLTGSGATADFIRQHEIGIVVEPSDVDALAHVLLEYLTKYKRNDMPMGEKINRINQFESLPITKQLVHLLDQCIVE